MDCRLFTNFFAAEPYEFLCASLDLALREDGEDLTSNAVFTSDARLRVVVVAKEAAVVAGLPLIPLILERCANGPWAWEARAREGERVETGRELTRIEGEARDLLKAERVILNYLTHLSGIATLTRRYVDALAGTGVRLLDTRKTLPGLRMPEKYAVLAGGGLNHRLNLSQMLMLKDNHIDAAGGIEKAVRMLRTVYGADCPPVEVECRTLPEVRAALAAEADRIMLDNMDAAALAEALPLIPPHVETEASGGVTLENIRALALASPRRPDYISVGRLTHSASAADFSMRILPLCRPT